MIEDVEFRYLDVKWLDKKTVKSLETSQDTIPFEKLENNDFLIETYTYQKYYPRVAIHIQPENQLHIPYVKNDVGKKLELISVKDPQTQKIWWIHSDGWDSEKKYYRTELYRTVGTVDLVVQNQEIKIKNNSISLTVEDLELYLQDFKDDLWQIILNQRSSIKGTVSKSSNMLSEEALSLFRDFSDSMEAILKKPTVELKETQEQKPFKQVRPVNRTFREVATKGFQKQLTSRSYRESYDTPDNRYLHFCAYRALYIVKQLSVILRKQELHLQRMIENNKSNIDRNNAKKTKKIERDVFDDETRRIEANYQEQRRALLQALNCQLPIPHDVNNLGEGTFQVTLSGTFSKYPGYFFANRINGEETIGNPNFGGNYAVLGMQEELSNWLATQKGDSKFIALSINGVALKGVDRSNPDKPFFYLYFYYVNNITLSKHQRVESELSDRSKRRQYYEESGWEVALKPKEVEELRRESAFFSKKNQLLESGLSSSNDILSTVEPIFIRLRKINRFFKGHKVKRSAVFPSTMSFVQNPLYAKAKSSFSKINKLDGMDGALFNSLFEFDEIGIINIPILYERWCLLQIIKLCSEVFGFEMLEDWQNQLIQAVTNNQYNIEFELLNPINNKHMFLGYEKTLENGVRPDFVLDMDYQGYVFKNMTTKEFVSYEQYHERNRNLDSAPSVYDHWLQGKIQRKRMVLDAKFKDNLFQTGFEDILKDLTENKNYDEDGKNQLFLLHPQGNAIQEKTSPLGWGKHSDYGQNLSHQKGFIFLLPSSKYGNTLDNLQRLLGMFIQSASYFFDYGSGNFWFDTTCVSCGTSSYNDFTCVKKKTEGGNNSWRITCKKCNHLTVKTVCFLCHKDLYKNQFNLTYHRTKAEQVSNVVCPSCQEFL